MTVLQNESRVDLIQRWAKQGYRTGAEIGTWAGLFAEQICRRMPGVRLLCVDPWLVYPGYSRDKKNHEANIRKAYESAKARLAPYHVTIRREMSTEAVQRVPDGSLDFVYIDANHADTFVTEDLTIWAPKVRRGGMVCGHDYVRDPKRPHLEVAGAVDRFIAGRDVELLVFANDKSPSFAWMVP